jgi:hypothetical protein
MPSRSEVLLVGALAFVLENRCPVLTSWAASPLQTSVGAWIDVSAAALDPDPGESVHFAWQPPARFETPGRQVITVQVSDDHRPKPCKSQLSITVTCVDR